MEQLLLVLFMEHFRRWVVIRLFDNSLVLLWYIYSFDTVAKNVATAALAIQKLATIQSTKSRSPCLETVATCKLLLWSGKNWFPATPQLPQDARAQITDIRTTV